MIACYGAGTIIGAFVGGKLSDRFSPGMISGISLIIEAMAYLILIKNHHFYFLMINLFFIGISAYSFITSNSLWVLAKCHANENLRLQALNILNVASNVGLGFSAVLMSFVTFKDFPPLFGVSSLILFCVSMYIFVLEKKSFTQYVHQNIKVGSISKKIYYDKIIMYVYLSLFCMGIIIAQTNSTYPLFLQETFPTMGMKSFSILFTVNTLMVVLFQTVLVDRFKKNNKISIIVFSVFFLGFSMLILKYSCNFSIALLSMIIMTIGEILFFSISQFICYEKSANNKKGQNLGIYRMVFACSRIAGPCVGAFIYQQFGSPQLWSFCFGLGLILALAGFFLVKEKVAYATA
jgi:MFS family permease